MWLNADKQYPGPAARAAGGPWPVQVIAVAQAIIRNVHTRDTPEYPDCQTRRLTIGKESWRHLQLVH